MNITKMQIIANFKQECCYRKNDIVFFIYHKFCPISTRKREYFVNGLSVCERDFVLALNEAKS